MRGLHPVTHFDKNDVEYAGLVKFDFLGLHSPFIKWALDMIDTRLAREGKPLVDIAAIPLDDPESFELLKRSETDCCIPVGIARMKELIKRLQPDCF